MDIIIITNKRDSEAAHQSHGNGMVDHSLANDTSSHVVDSKVISEGFAE